MFIDGSNVITLANSGVYRIYYNVTLGSAVPNMSTRLLLNDSPVPRSLEPTASISQFTLRDIVSATAGSTMQVQSATTRCRFPGGAES
jgi:hypothetical protein